MPKHAVNTTEQNKIRKYFLAGNEAPAIAAYMNVDLAVVERFHPDAVAEKKEQIRQAEIAEGAKQAETESKAAEADAAAVKRSEAGKKAAATRAANAKQARDKAKLADQKAAEERERVQAEQAAMREFDAGMAAQE